MIAKANELKKQKAVAQARLRKAGHQGRQDKVIRSSIVTADQNLAPTGHNVEASAPYTIKSSPGKGLGMFTTKDIAKGTRILAEKRGSRKNALEYASKELDVDLCCVGRDSPSYTETINFFLKVYFGAEEVFD